MKQINGMTHWGIVVAMNFFHSVNSVQNPFSA
jgi:hypothetical protein